ncbi:MAG: DUF547 domain-containing protein [Planctomycetota bacterium]
MRSTIGFTVLILVAVLWTGTVTLLAGTEVPTPTVEAPDLDAEHRIWGGILSEVVLPDGVDYQHLASLRGELDRYRVQLATATVPEDPDAAMAFWINAYNALTLELVLRTWPDEPAAQEDYSVRDVEGFWTAYTFEVAGGRHSLDHIEHGIIRPMGDPRIHMAVNCASVSCPPLHEEPYIGSRLDAQLDRAARHFVDSDYHVRVEKQAVRVNPILKWFSEDFEEVGGVRAFLLAYSTRPELTERLQADRPIRFFAYDWSLNRASGE